MTFVLLFRLNDLRQPHIPACVGNQESLYTREHLSQYWHETREKKTSINLFYVWDVFRVSPVTHQLFSHCYSLLLAPADLLISWVWGKHKDFYEKSIFAVSEFPNCPNSIPTIFPCLVHLFYHPCRLPCSPSRSVFTSDYWDHSIRWKAGRGADILHFFGIVTVPLNVRQWAALCSVLSDSPVSFNILKLAWHLWPVSLRAHWLMAARHWFWMGPFTWL